MISADAIIGGILQREGWPQFTNRASDKGGPTKGGVTLAALGAFLGRPASVAELQDLSEKQARAFYAQRYCEPYGAVPEPLRTLLIDIAVTSWHDDAARYLHAALAAQGAYQGAIDGKAGPMTWAALRALQARPEPDRALRRIYFAIVQARTQQLLQLALADAATQQFLREHPEQALHNARGWQARSIGFFEALV